MASRFSQYVKQHVKQRCLLAVLCLLCLAPVIHADETAEKTLQSALEQAEHLRLASHETWLALLHYKRETISRRFISQADDDRFFLDNDGRLDANAELRADIHAFFNIAQKSAVHAQCLFPARWWWLKQQLNISDEFDVSCPKLDAFMKRVAHDRLFLVFPSMYLNNPGSTFGHTFLRFDGEENSILLSQTLNYAARVDHSDNLMSYVSKGLFGGYNGFFRARQYYETVQEYNNIENRDIWEYQLDFTDAEIEQLVRHVWEVKGIDFDYYFFRENCAYRLLALLDVMRPGMQLTGENNFQVYAIPVDTVRALDELNLIQSREFRASLATQIKDHFAAENKILPSLALEIAELKQVEIQDARLLIGEKLQTLSSQEERLEVLLQSYKILQFNGLSSSVQAQSVLRLINEMLQPVPDDTIPSTKNNEDRKLLARKSPDTKTPDKKSPETGHDSIRMAAGYGEQNSLSYIDLKIRPAFHDLLDAPQGYVNGAAINAFEAHIKWFVNNDPVANGSVNKARLESLSLFNVASLSPLTQWQKPISWMFDFRFDRTQLSQTNSVRNFISRGGAGYSVRRHGITPYAMLMGEWNLASAYDKGYSILLGVQAGVHLTLQSNQVMLSYQVDNAVSGFDMDRKVSQLQWQYNLQVNHALRLKYKYSDYRFYNDEDWSLNYNYYF